MHRVNIIMNRHIYFNINDMVHVISSAKSAWANHLSNHSHGLYIPPYKGMHKQYD